MTIDISKIRPGDRVTLVPLEVKKICQGIEQVQLIDSDGSSTYFSFDQIAAHHPAPREFQVGDRVRLGLAGAEWVIEHIAHGRAWISRDDGREGWIQDLDNLTLVEGGE